MKSKQNFFIPLMMLMLAFVLFASTSVSKGQDITHPLSEISSTAQFYSYIHRINDTTGIEIKYFIVESPTEGIKTAFDACDVCWAQHKGYTQVGGFMRCRNCGNTYPTDGLGAQGTGGCWPSYLPHTTDATDLIIQVSDLIPGAFMFEEVPMDPPQSVGISHGGELPVAYSVKSQIGQVSLEMPTTGAARTIRMIGMNGQVCFQEKSSLTELTINTGDLSAGIYLLSIEEGGKLYTQEIYIK